MILAMKKFILVIDFGFKTNLLSPIDFLFSPVCDMIIITF
ncbi:hypothetical protein ASZ90_005212 [hydrocarbon metagenome]|uniref:Uncharacterized protein n=1 Tax=hydrocarbon metagenome TaxID=938273 RepID=A0A0W8FVM6_9ZZZZ